MGIIVVRALQIWRLFISLSSHAFCRSGDSWNHFLQLNKIHALQVAGVEELETGQAIHDSLEMEFQVIKARPSFKLILGIFLLSYALTFVCISFINPIADLYANKGGMFYANTNLQTHIALHNHHLEITQQQKKKKSELDALSCSSLINDVGGKNASGGHGKGILCCDRSRYRTDVCYLRGDVRTHTETASISVHTHNHKLVQEKIRPYTRKWEQSTMNTIDEITLKTGDDNGDACQVQHDVPAIVFSTGGYTGNVYHEFNDGLIPLYITSQHLHGQVVFVILEYHNWWMTKYAEIVTQLTNYPVIDFSNDKRVHCFPEMIVGLNIHDELTVNPELMKDGKSIGDFRALLSKAYAPRLSSMPQKQSTDEEHSSSLKASGLPNVSQLAKLKLVIISRQKSREMMNQKAIVKLGEKIGFEVEILNPKRNTEMVDMFRALNSCDVMVGVHGAAMTHFLFMRPGSVFIQIVPLGTDWASATYYGQPATKLGLTYLEYKILPEESSLFAEYERNDPVLRDPDSINRKGWEETKRVYLDGQNVKPSLQRFNKTLLSAYSSVLARKYEILPSVNR
ncbi:hypothetical protein SUGI_0991860 [Cryptomeria japonica]|uniref:xylan glycosyltransferase MUCI21 n=1 Tax=Cryptomeria japonica TaxID=3369 RepID=UPI0024146BCE|nr:xylan glycosyltransferase MUCI21 [Cryptomeria japonica]GLJ46993.1 hypothetical protein SUGI_0991860 [Cryptomeria japonica]